MSDIIVLGIVISLLIAGIIIYIAAYRELRKAQKIWGEKRR